MENKLEPEFKQKWIAALRSGKYNQGTSALVNTINWHNEIKSYCCLGVAGCILGIPDDILAHYSMFNDRFFSEPRTKEYRELIPEVLKGDYDSDKKSKIYEEISNTLALMNDNYKSFKEIADYIETDL